MKKFFSILVAAMLSTTMWAETVTVDGIQYDVNTATHVATVVTNQCFNVRYLNIPYHIDVEGTEYTVSISNTNFSYWRCNVDSLVSLRLAEGHTQTGTMGSVLTHLQELSLPASCTQVVPTFSQMPHLRRLVCRAVTPPALPTQSSSQQVYDSTIVYVPAESVAAYQAHADWGRFQHIVAMLGEMNRIIEIGSYHYELDESAHRAYMLHGFGPFPANISVPYLVTYEGENYTVDISRVQFNLMIAEPITKLQLAEGHTWLSFTYDWQFLETLDLPSTFQTFADDALSQCHGLTKIICRAVTPPSMAASPSATACTNAQLWVPQASIDAYRAHPDWGRFTNIVPISDEGDSRVEVDSIQYDLDTDSHIAFLPGEQCFPHKTVIPYHITVDEIEYTVSIENTNFSDYACNADNIVSFCLTEGYSQMKEQSFFFLNLQELYLPSSFVTANGGEFSFHNLRKLTCLATTPPDVTFASNMSFDNMTLYVPEQAVDAYRGDGEWGRFVHIEPIEDPVEIDDILYYLDTDSHIASVASEQCFGTNVKIPYQIEVEGTEFSVSLTPYTLSLEQCNYKNLSSIGFAEEYTQISISPINQFTNLVKLSLPSTLTELNVEFNTFPNLRQLICLATTPPSIPSDRNNSQTVYEDAILYVPLQSIDDYRSDADWGKFQHIVPYSQVDIDGIEYELDESSHTATIPSNQCFHAVKLEIPYHINVDGVEYTVSIDNTDFSLMQCNRDGLRELHLAEGHTQMGPQSNQLTNLQELYLPSTFTKLNVELSKFPNLRTLVCRADLPPVILNKEDLLQIYDSATVYVPTGFVDFYRADPVWGRFTKIIEEEFGVVIDGVPYLCSPLLHTASVHGSWCFSKNVMIPYHINVEGTEYTVSISSTNFTHWQCSRDSMVSFHLGEGHTEMMAMVNSFTNVQELFLPSTFTDLNNSFELFPSLRSLICLASTPPAVELHESEDTLLIFDNAVLYVPKKSIPIYRGDSMWGRYTNIRPYYFDGDTMLVDSLQYQMYPSKGKAVLISDQLFYTRTTIPYQVQVDSTIYKVDISQTDFGRNHENRTIVRILRFEEGFDTIPGTFYYLDSLNILQLPSTLREIGNLDFTKNLSQVECRAVTPPALKSISQGTYWEHKALYVPYGSIEAYRANTRWSMYFINILPLQLQEGDSIVYNNVKYIAHPSTHTMTVPSEQCFWASSIAIPYQIPVGIDTFRVDISATDFLQTPCNTQSLRTLQIEAGHSILAAQSAGDNVLSRLYLPSTMQSIAGLGSFDSLRSLTCLAAVPPVLEDTTWCMAYDSTTLYVLVNMYNNYRLHPVWGRFRKILPLGYHLTEATDTVDYHNTIQYAVSDSLGAVVLRLVQPKAGNGIVIADSVPYGASMIPVVSIADSAFSDVAGMQYIEVPHRAPICGNGSFRGWSKNTVVIVPEDSCVASYRNASYWGDFTHIVARRQAGDTITLEYCHTAGKPYQLYYRVLPDRRNLCLVRPAGGYTAIPNKAAELSDVVMDKKLVPYRPIEIGDSVLAGCTQVEIFSLNASTRQIGNGILSGCTALTTISVDSANTEYYSPDATSGIVRRSDHVLLWGSLSSLLNDSVQAIGAEAFAGLPLPQLTLPASITAIGAHAFRDCPLELMRLLGTEPAALAGDAFEGVDSEMVLFVPRTACDTYRTHPDWSRFQHITPWYEAGDTITQHHAAGAYTSEYTLYYRVLDESSLELMAPSYRLEDGLAAGVVDLTDTLAFRFVVTQLADGALRGCRDVHTVHLGQAVTMLGDSVFYGCSQLNHIICDALTPPSAERATFEGMDLNARVDVPAGMHDIYKVADGWRYFYCFNPIVQDPNVDPAGKPGSEMGLEDLLSADEVVKVVMDGHVWIIRDGAMYDLLGRRR